MLVILYGSNPYDASTLDVKLQENATCQALFIKETTHSLVSSTVSITLISGSEATLIG